MSRLRSAILAGLIISLLGLLLSRLPFGPGLEENVDLYILFKLRGKREPPSNVVIVNIDKVSAEKLDISEDPEEWSRSLHARLTENLARKGAAVIAFDIIFDEARSKEEDDQFAKAIENAQNVVLGELLRPEAHSVGDEEGIESLDLSVERLVPPIAPLAESALALAPFPLPKVPVRVSQYWTFKSGAGDRPTLPVVAFQIYALRIYDDLIQLLEKLRPSQLERLPKDEHSIIRTKGVEQIVMDLRDAFRENPSAIEEIMEGSQETGPNGVKSREILNSLIKMYQSPDSRYLNFYGPPGTIPTVCYYQALEDQKSNTIPKQVDFDSKAVFIGLSEQLRPEQKDGFHTVFSQPTGVDLSGVEIAATAFSNLTEDLHVRPLSSRAHVVVILIWGTLTGFVCRYFSTLKSAGTLLALGAIYLMAAHHQFKQSGIWYPLVFPLFFQAPFAFFGTFLWRFFETNRERQDARRAISYYLPNELLDQLTKNLGDLKKTDRVVYGTCLFTDAEHYTTLSETMEPRELSQFMDRYFEVLFKPVKKYGGLVVDIKGDSMLALWKAAQPDAALRKNACLAALEIAEAVRLFNQSSDTLKLPTRIGLHSGELLLGTVGAVDHYEYRPTGDTVNTASRLEGLNKHLGTLVVVSEDVLDQLDGFMTRELGEFRPEGKSRSISAHELVCRLEDCTEEQERLCERFAKALRAFKKQLWDEAESIFKESLRLYGRDGPSKFYLKKCQEYKANPPEEKWDGIVHLEK